MKPSDPCSFSSDAASQDGRTPVLQPPDIQPSASQPRIAVDHAWSNGVVATDLLSQLSQGMALDVFVADVDSSCQDHTESVMKAGDKVVIAHRHEIDQMNSRFDQTQRRHEAEVATLKQDIQLLKQAEQKTRLAKEAAEKNNKTHRHLEAGEAAYSIAPRPTRPCPFNYPPHVIPPTSVDGPFGLVSPEWRLASERLAARDAASQITGAPIDICSTKGQMLIDKVIADGLAAQKGDGGAQNPASPCVFSCLNETQEMDILSDEEHGNADTLGMPTTNHSAFDASTLETGVLIGTAERTHRSRSPRPVG